MKSVGGDVLNTGNPADGAWVDRFIHNGLVEHGFSANTRQAYALDISLVSRWAALRNQSLIDLTTADLARYVRERADDGLHASTLARHLSSCRRFFAFVVAAGGRTDNPALGVRVRPEARDGTAAVSRDAVQSLLRPPVTDHLPPLTAYRCRRNHAIICLLYGTRLCVSAVRQLRWDQVDLESRAIEITARSGTTTRVTIGESVAAALAALREAAAQTGTDIAVAPFCFPTSARRPMTRQALCYTVRKWARERGDDGTVTPTMLRKSGPLPVRRPPAQSWTAAAALDA